MPGNEKAPEVSVIITTYQRPQLLVEAIGSVLAQTYQDFELIVADDGSGDETAARVAAFGNRIRYMGLAHSGRPEVVRNQAAASARGRYLAFLDDDDLWHEEKLAQQMAALARSPAAGYSYTDCRFMDANGDLTAPLLSPLQCKSEAVVDNLLRSCFVHPSTVVMRQELYGRLAPVTEEFFSQGDYYLWLKAALEAPVVCVCRPLMSIRRSASGLAHQRRLVHVENAIRVLERIAAEEHLSWRQRWLARRTLARWYTHLGLREEGSGARRRLLWALWLNPVQRAAWRGLIGGTAPEGTPTGV